MSSRALIDVGESTLKLLLAFEKKLTEAGITFVRACTYRSSTEQDALYAQGRTTPGTVVTWAHGGQSPHNTTENGIPASQAADYYPLLNGKLADCKTADEIELWQKMGQIGKTCGLEWGGDWPAQKRDMPHFQLPKEH